MRYSWILSALLGLSLIQCSSSESKGPKYPDSAAFCAGVAAAECSDAILSACLATSGKQNCVDLRKAACNTAYVVPNAGLTYDSGKAQTCVDKITAAYSKSSISAQQFMDVGKACEAVYSGTGTKGTACENNTDCKQSDGYVCLIHGAVGDAGSAVEGKCLIPQAVAVGESCSAPESECDVDHYCDPGMHCVASGVLNDACSTDVPCKSQYMCGAGKCVSKLAEAAPCVSSEECASGLCLETVKLCASQETFAPSEPFCVAIRGKNDAG